MIAAPHTTKRTTQFSLRAIAVLTAASAVWIWIVQEMPAAEMAVFAGVALVSGIVGHLVYVYCLRSRVTVMVTVLLLYNLVLGAQLLVQSGHGTPWFERLAFLSDVLFEPLRMMSHVTAPRDILLLLRYTVGTLVFTAAHSIRPSLPAAIITALGIAIWYGCSVLIMANAG